MLVRSKGGFALKSAFQIALAVALSASLAAGHHPGHGPSESLRALNALGTNAMPRQRAALFVESARTSAEPTLNASTATSVTALVSLRAWERLYLTGAVPVGVVQEDSSDDLKFGQGDARLGAQVALGSMKLAEAPSVTVGLTFSIPTRTIRYEFDPGKQWIYSPGVRYAASYRRFLWYAALLSPVETRPAGVSWELSPTVGIGYRLLRPWALSAGAALDVRLFNWCAEASGLLPCPDGRTTELDRPVGATRLYATLASTVDLSAAWSIFGNVQLPITTRRDIEWAMSLGVEGRF